MKLEFGMATYGRDLSCTGKLKGQRLSNSDFRWKNGYPQNFINSIFKKFLQSKYTADIKYPVFGPQKKSIYMYIFYLIVVFKAKN